MRTLFSYGACIRGMKIYMPGQTFKHDVVQDLHRHDAMSSGIKHAERTASEAEGKWLAAEDKARKLQAEVTFPCVPLKGIHPRMKREWIWM